MNEKPKEKWRPRNSPSTSPDLHEVMIRNFVQKHFGNSMLIGLGLRSFMDKIINDKVALKELFYMVKRIALDRGVIGAKHGQNPSNRDRGERKDSTSEATPKADNPKVHSV